MKIFFDTKFHERGYGRLEFISLGMVKQDGAELYGISHELSWSLSLARARDRIAIGHFFCSDWVTDNVCRHLKDTTKQLISLNDITKFCGDSPEFWADYSAYDWVTLCQLFGTMLDLPKGWPMFCRDFRQHLDSRLVRIERTPGELGGSPWHFMNAQEALNQFGPKQDPATFHHALHDARHLKAQYDFIQSRL